LLASALNYPDRLIFVYFLFPIRLKYLVMILGAISFLYVGNTGGGTSHTSHLGGLVVGYLYLKGGMSGFIGEIKYQYLKWKMRRLRSRFGVHPGGRQDDWDRRIH